MKYKYVFKKTETAPNIPFGTVLTAEYDAPNFLYKAWYLGELYYFYYDELKPIKKCISL